MPAAGRRPRSHAGVEVTFGDARKVVPLVPTERPGEFRATLVPTRPGTYAFRVSAVIDDREISTGATCGEGTFDCVIRRPRCSSRSPTRPPARSPGGSKAPCRAADDAADDADSAKRLAIAAIAVALIALAAAIVIGVRARRPDRPVIAASPPRPSWPSSCCQGSPRAGGSARGRRGLRTHGRGGPRRQSVHGDADLLEQPEASLSDIEVLDESGTALQSGPAQAVSGEPLTPRRPRSAPRPRRLHGRLPDRVRGRRPRDGRFVRVLGSAPRRPARPRRPRQRAGHVGARGRRSLAAAARPGRPDRRRGCGCRTVRRP